MKTHLILLSFLGLMTGCATTHSLPPENYGITQTVTKQPRQDLPKVQGEPQPEVVYIVPEEAKLTPEEFQALSKAIAESVKGNSCMCHAGDPLCSCVGVESNVKINNPDIKVNTPR